MTPAVPPSRCARLRLPILDQAFLSRSGDSRQGRSLPEGGLQLSEAWLADATADIVEIVSRAAALDLRTVSHRACRPIEIATSPRTGGGLRCLRDGILSPLRIRDRHLRSHANAPSLKVRSQLFGDLRARIS